jgi:transposase
VSFLSELVASQPKDQEIHVILDNLSAHKSKQVNEFLSSHPQVHFHFTPTYSSWLNQVELWFSKIERDVIARGVFTSVKNLSKKLLRYIRQYNRNASPSSGSTLIPHDGFKSLPLPRRQATSKPSFYGHLRY